jgi:hypothetical protein
MALTGIPLGEWSGSGATDRLHETITEFNSVATKQTVQMIRLTRCLVVLTCVLCIGLVVQIVLAVV